MGQPILYQPKLFLIKEIKRLFTFNLDSLTLYDLNKELKGLYGNLLGMFFGVEMIEKNEHQAYLKPLNPEYTYQSYNWHREYFGGFEKITPRAQFCKCQIIIKNSKSDPENYMIKYFFVERFERKPHCVCGRKISHYHCNICGGREDPKNTMIKFEHIKTYDDSAKKNFLNHFDNIYTCSSCMEKISKENAEYLYPDIPDINNRIQPGEVVPIGQCPCGGLLYQNENDFPNEEEDK